MTKDRFRNPRGSLFFMSGDKFELNFLSPDAFELKSMEGNMTRYRRAQPYAPTAEQLKAFAGRYTNDETRAVLEIAPAQDALMIRVSDMPQRFEFKPVERDAFQWRGMIVRFQRDKSGKVVGIDYSNPIVRRIQFTRG
jgi:hypothetical protein